MKKPISFLKQMDRAESWSRPWLCDPQLGLKRAEAESFHPFKTLLIFLLLIKGLLYLGSQTVCVFKISVTPTNAGAVTVRSDADHPVVDLLPFIRNHKPLYITVTLNVFLRNSKWDTINFSNAGQPVKPLCCLATVGTVGNSAFYQWLMLHTYLTPLKCHCHTQI